jgi:hypothetical protein
MPMLNFLTIFQVAIKLNVVIRAATALDGGVCFRSLSEAFKASHKITALKSLSNTVSRLLSYSHRSGSLALLVLREDM